MLGWLLGRQRVTHPQPVVQEVSCSLPVIARTIHRGEVFRTHRDAEVSRIGVANWDDCPFLVIQDLHNGRLSVAYFDESLSVPETLSWMMEGCQEQHTVAYLWGGGSTRKVNDKRTFIPRETRELIANELIRRWPGINTDYVTNIEALRILSADHRGAILLNEDSDYYLVEGDEAWKEKSQDSTSLEEAEEDPYSRPSMFSFDVRDGMMRKDYIPEDLNELTHRLHAKPSLRLFDLHKNPRALDPRGRGKNGELDSTKISSEDALSLLAREGLLPY